MHQQDLTRGEPRFADAELSALERENNPMAAWQAAFARMQTVQDAVQWVGDAQGHFSVALFDVRGRALVAVDRFATHTLCLRVDGGQIHVAERAEALARAELGLDCQALLDYLVQHSISSPQTVFPGVQRLPAGHVAWFADGALTVMPYWQPRFDELRAPSFETLKSRFLKHLEDAVAADLDGSPPACFLSGGTDSSTIAGMIGRTTGHPASTWSIGFEAEGYDEMEYARLAARHFGTRHNEYYVTPEDLLIGIPLYAAHCDQPFGNSSALPAYWCARRAKEAGITRLLAGDGGDELFGGNSRYAKQKVFHVFEAMPQPIRTALTRIFAVDSPLARLPLLKKGVSYVEQARVPMPQRDEFYNLLLRSGPEQVLTEAFASRTDSRAASKQRTAVWAQTHADASELNKNLAYDWRFTLAESDLPKVRSSSELAGIDVRYPLLDQALLDFSLTLPTHYKVRGMQLRWFFKEALRGFLPDAILSKRKHGFGLPFGVWCVRHKALGAFAGESLRSLARRGLVKEDYVRALLADLLPQHPGFYGEMVWVLLMLEQWLQHHLPDWRLPVERERLAVPPCLSGIGT